MSMRRHRHENRVAAETEALEHAAGRTSHSAAAARAPIHTTNAGNFLRPTGPQNLTGETTASCAKSGS